MRSAEKLLIAAGIGRSVYEGWRLHKVLPVVVTVGMLSVTAAVMTMVMAFGGTYALYLFLVGHGLEQAGALLVTMLVVLFITLALIFSIRHYVKKLKMRAHTPLENIADAFIEGLLGE